MSQALLFELGDSTGTIGTFGIDVANVWQVIEPLALKEVPLCPPIVEGIMSHGGRIVTVVDPSPVLGFTPQDGEVKQVVIVRDETRPHHRCSRFYEWARTRIWIRAGRGT